MTLATPSLFPFVHDWGTPFQIARTYATDVQTAADGSEIRPGISADAAISFRMQSVFLESGAGRMLASWRGASRPLYFYAPLWCDVTELTVQANIGATTLTCDTADRPFLANGGKAMLWTNEQRAEIVSIGTVSSGSVSLSSGTVAAYAVTAKLVPVRPMWLDVAVPMTWQSGRIASVAISFSDVVAQAGLSIDDSAASPVVDTVQVWSDSFGREQYSNVVGRGEFLARAFAFDANGVPIPGAQFTWTAVDNEGGSGGAFITVTPSLDSSRAHVVASTPSSTVTAHSGGKSATIGAS